MTQAVHGERVPTLTPVSFDDDEPGFEEPLEVSSHSRPAAREAVGELAGGHRATPSMQHQEDVPTGFVRERSEDSVDVVELSECR